MGASRNSYKRVCIFLRIKICNFYTNLYGVASRNSGRVYTRINCIFVYKFEKKHVTFSSAFEHLAINQCSSKRENGYYIFACLLY